MKKKYFLMICGSLLVASIAASTVVISKMIANADPADQILVSEYSYYEDFDAFDTNQELSHQAFYIDYSIASVVEESAIKGKSMKLDIPHKLNWGSINFKSDMLNLKNSEFHLEFACKTENIDSIDIPILKNYDGDYYAQYGVKITNDSDGKPQSIDFRYGASLIKEKDVLNPKRELNNGVITIGFDFTIGETMCYPSIRFHSTKDNAFVILDNIIIVDKNNPGEYYDIQYKDDFNNISGNDVFNTTPFWCHSGSIGFVNIYGDKKVKYSGSYGMPNGDNSLLGGLTRTEITTLPNTLYYYSYDLMFENIEELVITTLDNRDLGQIYSEITYLKSTDQFRVTFAGGINNFKVVKEGDVYHVSYNRQTSSFGEDEHKFFATSDEDLIGSVIIDNVVIAHK